VERRSFLIVGAGQSGLQLGIGLLDDGHDVTLATNRPAEEVRNGYLLSGQTQFGNSLATERELGIDLWQDEAPQLEGMAFALFPPRDPNPVFDWGARLDLPGQSVDQRVKYPAWMELFEERGGRLEIAEVGIPELERYGEGHDLVIVSAGRDTRTLFARVPEHSPFDKPQKIVSIAAVHGVPPREPWDGVCFTMVPGHGENIVLPTLGPSGPGHLIVFQFFPDGGWGDWPDTNTMEEHLAHSKELLKEFLPRMYERCRHAEPMDDKGFLRGGVTPVVREPVGELPSGRLVLGLGDALVVNDPLTAPGANSVALAATHYRAAIRAHGDAPYDREFMERTFYDFWNSTMRYYTEWNNMLLGPVPDHVAGVLVAGNEVPAIRDRFVNGFANRADYWDWLVTPDKAEAYLEQVAS
jgi:hypothetical protein